MTKHIVLLLLVALAFIYITIMDEYRAESAPFLTCDYDEQATHYEVLGIKTDSPLMLDLASQPLGRTVFKVAACNDQGCSEEVSFSLTVATGVLSTGTGSSDSVIRIWMRK